MWSKVDNFIDSLSKYSFPVIRISLGLVFMYFGWNSITNPGMFAGLVPAWTVVLASAETLVRMHGIVEITLGILLAIGVATRPIALILFFDLLHVLTLLPFGLIWVRDFGLAGSMLSVVLRKKNN